MSENGKIEQSEKRRNGGLRKALHMCSSNQSAPADNESSSKTTGSQKESTIFDKNLMSLKDFCPDYLFLNQVVMQKTLAEDEHIKGLLQKRAEHGAYILTSFFSLVPLIYSTYTLFVAKDSSENRIPLVISIFSVAFFLFLLVWNAKGFFTICYEYKQYKKASGGSDKRAFDKVVQEVLKVTRYTAVIVIANKLPRGETLSFLCRTKDSFLFHCYLDPEKSIEESKTTVRGAIIDAFNLKETDIDSITALDDEPMFSIKLVNGKVQSNALVMYSVKMDERAKDMIQDVDENLWRTVDEMRKDPLAMQTNYDIIDKLESKRLSLNDSFRPRSANLHVIWNITKKCDMGCKICATRDEPRCEATAEEKLKILYSLATEKNRIKMIDFAGGDPCQSDDSVEIIKNAILLFGQDTISVTTTAKGIQNLSAPVQRTILSQCEITLDAAHSYLSADASDYPTRGLNHYSATNAQQLAVSSDCIKNLTINIPILNDDLNDDEIEKLAKEIDRINKQCVTTNVEAVLIRLMPVGGHGADEATKKDYSSYNPIKTARKIKAALLQYDIPCKYHCSLRTLDCLQSSGGGKCSLLDRKIGIDSAGNVFACAWGGYLPGYDTIPENPFYLGNLLEKNLSEILSSENETNAYRRIRNMNNVKPGRNYCEVVSRFNNPADNSNRDPLAQNNEGENSAD